MVVSQIFHSLQRSDDNFFTVSDNSGIPVVKEHPTVFARFYNMALY